MYHYKKHGRKNTSFQITNSKWASQKNKKRHKEDDGNSRYGQIRIEARIAGRRSLTGLGYPVIMVS
jgi:hypothetical protein